MSAAQRIVRIDPHHPQCTYPDGPATHAGLDPERCAYCAALVRQELFNAREDPLDYRYRADR
jgi:hypothetical protein